MKASRRRESSRHKVTQSNLMHQDSRHNHRAKEISSAKADRIDKAVKGIKATKVIKIVRVVKIGKVARTDKVVKIVKAEIKAGRTVKVVRAIKTNKVVKVARVIRTSKIVRVVKAIKIARAVSNRSGSAVHHATSHLMINNQNPTISNEKSFLFCVGRSYGCVR